MTVLSAAHNEPGKCHLIDGEVGRRSKTKYQVENIGALVLPGARCCRFVQDLVVVNQPVVLNRNLRRFPARLHKPQFAIPDDPAFGWSVVAPSPEVGFYVPTVAVKIHIAPRKKGAAVIPMVRRSDIGDAFAGGRVHWMKTARVIARKRNVIRLPRKVCEHSAAISGLKSFTGRRRFKGVLVGLAFERHLESGCSDGAQKKPAVNHHSEPLDHSRQEARLCLELGNLWVYTLGFVKRRDFLIGSAATLTAGRMGCAQDASISKLDRIAVMTLAFNSVLKSPDHPNDPDRTLDLMDAPDMIADRFGVHHVEVQHTHFASTESSYLRDFRARLKKAKSRMNQVCLELGDLNISSPNSVLRLETIDLTKEWIDHAVELGCPRVMINQGSLAPEVRSTAIETLKTIGDYGKARKVWVTMENRGTGGPNAKTADWEVVVEVIKAAGIHANPDTGNFHDEEARHAGLRALYPLSSGSSHVHYDPERFNEADALKVSKESGYTGLYSIEATRKNGSDPYVAVKTIMDEILKDI